VGRSYNLVADSTEREYFVNKEEFTVKELNGKPHYSANVHYAVGQPMGALSSWAMLAITHHAMMQFASSRCGNKS